MTTRTICGQSPHGAFSDGVIAVIIMIMVLEMKVPHGDELATLQPVIPVFIDALLAAEARLCRAQRGRIIAGVAGGSRRRESSIRGATACRNL